MDGVGTFNPRLREAAPLLRMTDHRSNTLNREIRVLVMCSARWSLIL